MRNRIVVIEHHPEQKDDRASQHLSAMGFDLDWRKPWQGDDLSIAIDDIAGSVIYGGIQNVSQRETYSYLKTEMHWIDRCLRHNIPLLGICLGGQLIAHTLGAAVRPHDDGLLEFGYYPIQPADTSHKFLSGELYVMQCHEQGFELPPGAQLLARGITYPNQAFSYGEHTYGLQFHPECTKTILERWQTSDWAPWNKPGVQTKEQQNALSELYDSQMNDWFRKFLGSLFKRPNINSNT